MRSSLRVRILLAGLLAFCAVPVELLPASPAHASSPVRRALPTVTDTTRFSYPYRIDVLVEPATRIMSRATARKHPSRRGYIAIGGAPVVLPGSRARPNQLMLVTLRLSDTQAPLSDANVRIAYRRLAADHRPIGKQASLPVARIRAAGLSPKLVAYGNNAKFLRAQYRVSVWVNKKLLIPVIIDFTNVR